MLEAKVNDIFETCHVENYEQHPESNSVSIRLSYDTFTLAEFNALAEAFGTEDITFTIHTVEEGALNGDFWTETRLSIYIKNITT